MTLRKVRGGLGLGLGLLVSLAAHVALFGGQHVVGGAYHAVLMQATSVIVLGFVAFVGALAWTLSGNMSDGRVLAAHLRERLPGFGTVTASAAVWYAGIEAIEPHHLGVPTIAFLLVLAAASYLVLRLVHAMTDAFARVAIAFSHSSFTPRIPAWRRRPRGRLISHHSFLARHRFARPPPIAFAFPRA